MIKLLFKILLTRHKFYEKSFNHTLNMLNSLCTVQILMSTILNRHLRRPQRAK